MMYSPDIPTATVGVTAPGDDRGSTTRGPRPYSTSVENYYARIDSEESAKCVVSTVLFAVVLIAFFLVALLMNPEM